MENKISHVKNFGKYLRKKRIQSGLTQSQVAGTLKYTTGQFISNWETGRSSPPMDILYHLAGLYRISTRELYGILLKQYEESLAHALRLRRRN